MGDKPMMPRCQLTPPSSSKVCKSQPQRCASHSPRGVQLQPQRWRHCSNPQPGKTFSEQLHNIFFPGLFCTICYWPIGLNPEPLKFLSFIAIVVLHSNVCQSMGLLVSASMPNAQVALAVGPVVIIPFMLFGGFFINLANIPVWFAWIQHLSPMKYTFVLLIRNEFAGLKFTCDEALKKLRGGKCPVDSGEDVIQTMSMDDENLTIQVVMLFVLLALFRLCAWFGLWKISRNKKSTA